MHANIRKYNLPQIMFTVVMLLIVGTLLFNGQAAAAALLAPVAAADLEQVAEEIKSVAKRFDNDRKELKEAQDELTRKMGEQHTTISKELKEAIDKALTDVHTKFEGMKGEVQAIEQKMVQVRDDASKAEVKSWGQQFIESKGAAALKEAGSGFSGVARAEVKQVDSAAAGGMLLRPYRDAEVVAMPRERQTIRSLLRVIPVNTSSVDYVVQTTRTNAVATVAEGAAKPYSDFAWSTATVPVRVLAHLAKLTRQAIDDAPRLVGEVDSEMRYGLGYVEERQILFGNNVGQNLNGIVTQATTFARPAGVGQMTNTTRIDALRVAMLQAALGLFPSDGIILNGLDWAMIELTKTTDGAYLLSNPQTGASPRLWGLPVVDTPAQVAGDFLVGNFTIGATLYDRMGVELLISTENVDDFERNLATMRAEERIALAVKRPTAFIKGTFATAKTALEAA